MKGSTRVVVGALVLIFLLSAFATAREDYARPVIKILKVGHTVIRYDGIAYHFRSPVPISITLDRIDERYVELEVKPVDYAIPTIAVSLWWEDFPINSLGIETGGDNSWTLDTETGYAEK
jgi:hypothetical protein